LGLASLFEKVLTSGGENIVNLVGHCPGYSTEVNLFTGLVKVGSRLEYTKHGSLLTTSELLKLFALDEGLDKFGVKALCFKT
jgi:hypothetical protein